jgi:hypothetical protein
MKDVQLWMADDAWEHDTGQFVTYEDHLTAVLEAVTAERDRIRSAVSDPAMQFLTEIDGSLTLPLKDVIATIGGSH